MLIRANTPENGVCFAWLPKSTPDGLVWLEYVRYEIVDSGFGGWRYTRLAVVTNREPTYYETPPHWDICKNFNPDGPTPCWYPHCECWTHSIRGKVYGR